MIVHVVVVEEKMKAVNIVRYTVKGVKAEHVVRSERAKSFFAPCTVSLRKETA